MPLEGDQEKRSTNIGTHAGRQLVSIAEWYRRHKQPIEEKLYVNLHRIAQQSRDYRAAVRASQIILDRIDPAPREPVSGDARPVNIAIFTTPDASPALRGNGHRVEILEGDANGESP